jgi:hypothetical protein
MEATTILTRGDPSDVDYRTALTGAQGAPKAIDGHWDDVDAGPGIPQVLKQFLMGDSFTRSPDQGRQEFQGSTLDLNGLPIDHQAVPGLVEFHGAKSIAIAMRLPRRSA